MFSAEKVKNYILQRRNMKNHYQLRLPAAAAKSLQSYLTLCNPTDGSPSGSSDPGILQARTLEWVAIASYNQLSLMTLNFNSIILYPWVFFSFCQLLEATKIEKWVRQTGNTIEGLGKGR